LKEKLRAGKLENSGVLHHQPSKKHQKKKNKLENSWSIRDHLWVAGKLSARAVDKEDPASNETTLRKLRFSTIVR